MHFAKAFMQTSSLVFFLPFRVAKYSLSYLKQKLKTQSYSRNKILLILQWLLDHAVNSTQKQEKERVNTEDKIIL